MEMIPIFVSLSKASPVFRAALQCGRSTEIIFVEIICGKHDMRKQDKTRGWQLVLSYSFKRRQVTAFVKGTPTSIISDSIDDLEHSANEASHPLLFPVIILSHLISMKTELDQRESRTLIRRLEQAISVDEATTGEPSYYNDGMIDLRAVARDLTECHRRVLHKRPALWFKILGAMEDAMQSFWTNIPSNEKTEDMERLHSSLQDRLSLQRARLVGLNNYTSVSIERLDIQRSMVCQSSYQTIPLLLTDMI